ncbi:MAG TPA: hypothetical protein VHZ09_20280 [Acidobacteriaceae bacterium]|jgi:hypothetical protein|nr:hypothetical protein [Acidobacteriaceae bacterium]
MKRAFWATLCLLMPLTAFAADDCAAPNKQDVDVKKTPIPLCLVAKKVALTLEQYNNDPNTIKDALPSLARADFDFKTVNSTTAGFKFCLLVFSFGASHQSQATNDVTFSYVVPPPPPKPPGIGMNAYLGLLGPRQVKAQDFSKELIETLQEAAEQIKQTRSVGAATFKTLTVTLAYGVTWDFNGGVTLPISLVTAGGTLDHNRADAQTIKLTFENQTAPKAMLHKVR